MRAVGIALAAERSWRRRLPLRQRPRGRLRKGGQGRADRPETMRPQFFAFPKRDAAHPSGDAAAPAALAWLGDGTVAACYEAGDVVAWRLPEEAAPAQ